MGLLPFDDWIYNLPFMRDEVDSKHDSAVEVQNTVQSQVLGLQKQLDKYKLLLVNNSILLYISTTVQMDDLQFADFKSQTDGLPAPVKGDTILERVGGEVELFGGIKVLKFVVNLGTFAHNIIAGTAEDMADGSTAKLVQGISGDAIDAGVVSEADADAIQPIGVVASDVPGNVTAAMIQDATSATLASTGVGIFEAVGIDAIFAAINGAKDENEVQQILNQLDSEMAIVNTFLSAIQAKSNAINERITEAITNFLDFVTAMEALIPAGQKPGFSVNFPPTLESIDDCLASQQQATTQFSLLTQLRETYIRTIKRNPHIAKQQVIESVALTAPDWVTDKKLALMWSGVLAKYSDLMSNAK